MTFSSFPVKSQLSIFEHPVHRHFCSSVIESQHKDRTPFAHRPAPPTLVYHGQTMALMPRRIRPKVSPTSSSKPPLRGSVNLAHQHLLNPNLGLFERLTTKKTHSLQLTQPPKNRKYAFSHYQPSDITVAISNQYFETCRWSNLRDSKIRLFTPNGPSRLPVNSFDSHYTIFQQTIPISGAYQYRGSSRSLHFALLECSLWDV